MRKNLPVATLVAATALVAGCGITKFTGACCAAGPRTAPGSGP